MGQHGGMPIGGYEDPRRVRSWITPKAAKGGASAIEGRGVHAVEAIAGGEVVAVKGGHIVDGSTVAGLPEAIRDSAFPIAADCFLAALTPGEYDGVMMRVNHSCAPNVGMGGNILLVEHEGYRGWRGADHRLCPVPWAILASPCNAGAEPRPAGLW
jgi:hypothetical protein